MWSFCFRLSKMRHHNCTCAVKVNVSPLCALWGSAGVFLSRRQITHPELSVCSPQDTHKPFTLRLILGAIQLSVSSRPCAGNSVKKKEQSQDLSFRASLIQSPAEGLITQSVNDLNEPGAEQCSVFHMGWDTIVNKRPWSERSLTLIGHSHVRNWRWYHIWCQLCCF